MKNFTTFVQYHNSESNTLDVILHGGSYDINSPFIQKVFQACKDKAHSVIAFNFPYIERGEEQSSGPELEEELETLQKFLDYCDYKNFKKIRLIGKSLGGIIASFYLNKLSVKEAERFSIIILGYVTGNLKLKNFRGEITVIQGEKDKFGDIETVKQDLKNIKSKKVSFFEIADADHSFRNPETKEPVYEDKAIKTFSNT